MYSFKTVSENLTWTTFGTALLGCLLLLVHTYNDFITGLPVTEGMLSSAISPVEVRQAFTVVPAIICINLGCRVPYNNAYPAQVFQTDDLFGNQLNGTVFTLRRPLFFGSDHRDNGLLSWTGGHENGNPHCRHRLLHLCQRRCRRHRVQALCHVRLGCPRFYACFQKLPHPPHRPSRSSTQPCG